MRVPLASSGLRDSDIDAAIRVLRSGSLTMGKEVGNFESKMAQYLGMKHFVMVNSGSSANLLMIEALMRPTVGKAKLSPGDCVLVPAIAWPTTIWPLIQLGLNPIFIDVDPSTLALDLKAAQEFINQSGIPIRGIFPIHPLGRAIPPSQLGEFITKNDLVLINDVCESLGSWIEGKHAGNVGEASSFSFYFSHHITTMEGGGIATNNDSMVDDLKSMRSHGWSRDRSDAKFWQMNKTSNDSKFLFVSTGYNVRPMEIQAAIGSLQIDEIDTFIDKRRQIAERVSESISGTRLSVIGEDTFSNDRNSHSWMLIPILVSGENASAYKELVLSELAKFEVETRPILTGNFLAQPAIQRITRHAVDPSKFSIANLMTQNAFMVGAHHDLSESQIEHLCFSLKSASQLNSGT